MIETDRAVVPTLPGDLVRPRPAGDEASGEFRCVACGYGITIARALPRCPMCAGEAWREVARPVQDADAIPST